MELKDLLSYTGIEADSIDSFKEKFQEKFAPKSEIIDPEKLKGELTGRITGSFQTKIKNAFGLETEEVANINKWEDLFELGLSKKNKEIESLKELGLKSNDGSLKELNEKLEKSNKMLSDYKKAAQQAQEALILKEQEFTGKFKTYKTESTFKDSFLKVQPKLVALKESEQFYLNHKIKENVFIDFDENDQPIVLNKEGKRWNDPNKAGGFLTPEAAIELIATQEGFIKQNNAGERRPVFQTGTQSAQNGQQQNAKQLHPNATKQG